MDELEIGDRVHPIKDGAPDTATTGYVVMLPNKNGEIGVQWPWQDGMAWNYVLRVNVAKAAQLT